YEREKSAQVVEQVVRPTGLIDPQVIVRPASTQVDDLLSEISLRVKKGERVLVTTLTKRMAEELTEYLAEHGVKVRYLHSDRETDSIKRAIAETDRRRRKQVTYNEVHSITPAGVIKRIKDLIDGVYDSSAMQAAQEEARYEAMSEKQIAREIKALEKKMLA